MPHRTSLVVASTHPLWLRGFLDLAYSMEALRIVGAAEGALQLTQLLQTRKPEALVIDAELLVPTRRLLGVDPHIPRILVVGAHAHAGTRAEFGVHCACGYLDERSPSDVVARLVGIIAVCWLPRAGLSPCVGCKARETLTPPPLPLTERENEVFVRIGWGHRPSQIATSLGVQVKTVDAHRESVKRKLGIGSAADLQAAAFAWREGDLLPEAQNGARTGRGRRRPST